MLRLASILLLLVLGACSSAQDDGVVDVAIIGEPDDPFNAGLRLSNAGQHVRAATAQGLVAMNASGQIVPAIAERWIVTDDGSSYIFRIREFDLPDGTRLTAQTVRDSLRRTTARLGGTSLGYDLSKIRDIRAMTGRVVEVRLRSPQPGLLQLLAQPELGLEIGGARIGPMALSRDRRAAVLDTLPPEQRGLPIQPDWDSALRQVRVTATDAASASEGFSDGTYDLVLGGTLANLPLADTGALSRGTVRLDSALGLFGLDVRNADGFLANPTNREALALAIDRETLIQDFNIAGWLPSDRIVPPEGGDASDVEFERWPGLDLADRRALAADRVAAWRGATGEDVTLSIALPRGPGSAILFEALAEQFGAVGISITRAESASDADLSLRDRVARYGGARWFLNQFHCEVSQAICSEDIDFLVQLAVESPDPAEAASYLAEAEVALTAFNPFIPFGAPVRWSLVRGDIENFVENPWSVHPLFPLSRAPI